MTKGDTFIKNELNKIYAVRLKPNVLPYLLYKYDGTDVKPLLFQNYFLTLQPHSIKSG